MGTATLVSLEEYQATTYHPDCDYVDGVLVERNVGQKDHSKLQGQVLIWFWVRRKSLGLKGFVEQRVKIAPARYRIPDICVYPLPEPDEQVFTTPPYLCVEILSPDDSLKQMQARFDDYLDMGVPNIWILDPESRRGWRATREGLLEARDGILRSHDARVSLPIAELFLDD